MTNLDSILKIRDITLPTKVHLVRAMAFPVVMYGCESRTVKKAEHWRIDAFELWCWRRLLRVPWTARRSNQSILKGISPEYSLEGLMLKLKLCPPDVKNWLIGKDHDAGKDWRQEEKGMTEDEMVWWHHQLYGHEFELVMDREAWSASVHGVTELDTLSDWTDMGWSKTEVLCCMLTFCIHIHPPSTHTETHWRRVLFSVEKSIYMKKRKRKTLKLRQTDTQIYTHPKRWA